jgi:hypothetical protein
MQVDMSDPLNSLQPNVAIYGDKVAGRSATVKKQIDALAGRMADTTWELAELLEEVHDNNFWQGYGFDDFDSYVDSDDSKFDMSSRQARYLIKINKGAKAIGIPVEALKAVKITKLKEIFTLDPNKFATEMHELVDVAKTESLEEIKERVRLIKGLDGQPEVTWRNFLVTREAAEIIDQAIERIKREFGDTMNEGGEASDISDGRALELMCGEKLSEPSSDYEPEKQIDDIEAQQA